MEKIIVKAYAKINLSLDVLGKLDSGYHEVEMVMQQILLHDIVQVRWFPKKKKNGQKSRPRVDISLSTNRLYLPTDRRNLAYQAAQLMAEKYGENRNGTIRIDIKKRIPVAAGMAGGSSNGAAVLHGINRLWNLKLPMAELFLLGSQLGSDVPFSLMGQAKMNKVLELYRDPLASHCAVARGTGTDMEPIRGLRSHLVLSKPPIGVSTAEVYRGLDAGTIEPHPNTEEMILALEENNGELIRKNMINVLENFTLKQYPSVMYTKNKMKTLFPEQGVLMSGSGPTVFALCRSREESQRVCSILSEVNKETFWTRTTF